MHNGKQVACWFSDKGPRCSNEAEGSSLTYQLLKYKFSYGPMKGNIGLPKSLWSHEWKHWIAKEFFLLFFPSVLKGIRIRRPCKTIRRCASRCNLGIVAVWQPNKR